MNKEILIELGAASKETKGCIDLFNLEDDIFFNYLDEPPVCQ